ncbi:MAG: hypothetical protein J0H68_03345 [Sphingobacteriia bacterium]|nr:hypothetical protein [Sphingobacteriia bacterium]
MQAKNEEISKESKRIAIEKLSTELSFDYNNLVKEKIKTIEDLEEYIINKFSKIPNRCNDITILIQNFKSEESRESFQIIIQKLLAMSFSTNFAKLKGSKEIVSLKWGLRVKKVLIYNNNFFSVPLYNNLINLIENFNKAHALLFDNNLFEGAFSDLILALNFCKGLRTLSLWNSVFLSKQAKDFESLSLKKITSLYLFDSTFRMSDFTYILSLPSFNKLNYINISNNILTTEFIKYKNEIENFVDTILSKNLRILKLAKCYVPQYFLVNLFDKLCNNNKLIELDLFEIRIQSVFNGIGENNAIFKAFKKFIANNNNIAALNLIYQYLWINIHKNNLTNILFSKPNLAFVSLLRNGINLNEKVVERFLKGKMLYDLMHYILPFNEIKKNTQIP